MNPAKWVMRDETKVETRATRNGSRTFVTLVCGHGVDLKTSRHKTEAKAKGGKPKRYRCDECTEIFQKFASATECAEVVRRVENDKPTVASVSRDTLAGRRRNLYGGGSDFIQRRFMRGN